jgi:FkbM family methyltransferase
MQSKENTMIQPTYYGQRGDDFLLWLPFLNRETPGYFVEVGALDGRRFSNTYSFEKQGWTGVCIEAHPDYIEILKQNRPNSQVVFAAAGDVNSKVTFYANSRGSLSTIDASLEEEYKKHGAYFTGFVEHEVAMLTLAQILADTHAPHMIDILSIDVEGAEMRVLHGMNWEQYQVRVVVIEADGAEVEAQIDEFFVQRKYHKARNYYGNVFYCSNAEDARIIAQTEVTCAVTHTPHPMDADQLGQQFRVVNSQLILPQNKNTQALMSKNVSSQWIRALRHYSKRLLRKVANLVSPDAKAAPKQNRPVSTVFEVGFHGDRYLLDLIDQLMPETKAFIETGTNVGTTAHYIASKYPHVQVYSCEPDTAAFATAQQTTASDSNVHLYNQLSPDFLYQLHREESHLLKTLNLYWMDAHDYGFQWPLHDEIRHITETLPSAIILVDDAKVQEHETEFRYCSYNEQECDFDYITNALAAGKTYRVFYPAYTEHTSKHHPLIGTMGILHGDVPLGASVFKHFTVVEVTK